MLKGHALCYFKLVTDETPRGSFSLAEYKPVDELVGGRPHSFRLVRADRPSDYAMVAAESSEDKDKWLAISGQTSTALLAGRHQS
eukprot:SAG22_NODE_7810_length_706_cov_0.599671_1_plen_85_part_00